MAPPPAPAETHNVAILGATGSIGRATLEVIEKLGRPWRIWGISGHRQVGVLEELARKYQPKMVVGPAERRISPCGSGSPDASACGSGSASEFGSGLVRLAQHPDVQVVVAAIVGRAGLESTLGGIASGKRVALANKETLVVAGPIVQRMLQEGNAELIPVDSEHSAIFQCLQAAPRDFAHRLILTASGGPMRCWTREKMSNATPEQALAHPTWRMGKKITIDSATMMNKALEIIEARWLFGFPADMIEVVVHPQSVVHSMVEFVDGSVISQMSPPDMRLPIQYALTHPVRLPGPARRLDRTQVWDLHFEPVDRERFPAIDLGFEVARSGGTAGAVINAANEEAVEQFLARKIRITDIVTICREVLRQHEFHSQPDLDCLLRLDRWARKEVQRWIGLG